MYFRLVRALVAIATDKKNKYKSNLDPHFYRLVHHTDCEKHDTLPDYGHFTNPQHNTAFRFKMSDIEKDKKKKN